MSLIKMSTMHTYPAARPLTADQILELHAARVLLLIHLCGEDNKIYGTQKFAKLDFFARFPQCFARVQKHLNGETLDDSTESALLYYGSSDSRYGEVLNYLRDRNLLRFTAYGQDVVLHLTESGLSYAERLTTSPTYLELCQHMRAVYALLGSMNSIELKDLIHATF